MSAASQLNALNVIYIAFKCPTEAQISHLPKRHDKVTVDLRCWRTAFQCAFLAWTLPADVDIHGTGDCDVFWNIGNLWTQGHTFLSCIGSLHVAEIQPVYPPWSIFFSALYSLGSTRNAPLVVAIWKRDKRLRDDISRLTAANSLNRCMKLDRSGCKYSWEKQKFENMHVVKGMENGRMGSKHVSSSQQSLM